MKTDTLSVSPTDPVLPEIEMLCVRPRNGKISTAIKKYIFMMYQIGWLKEKLFNAGFAGYHSAVFRFRVWVIHTLGQQVVMCRVDCLKFW